MTLRQLPTPCHHLQTPGGTPYLAGDGEPHFPHEASAADYRAGDSELSNHTVGTLDEACWVLSCDGPECDVTVLDEDEGGGHFASGWDATVAANHSGWRTDRRGREIRHLCPVCAEDQHCARGDHYWREVDASVGERVAECLTCGKRGTSAH